MRATKKGKEERALLQFHYTEWHSHTCVTIYIFSLLYISIRNNPHGSHLLAGGTLYTLLNITVCFFFSLSINVCVSI